MPHVFLIHQHTQVDQIFQRLDRNSDSEIFLKEFLVCSPFPSFPPDLVSHLRLLQSCFLFVSKCEKGKSAMVYDHLQPSIKATTSNVRAMTAGRGMDCRRTHCKKSKAGIIHSGSKAYLLPGISPSQVATHDYKGTWVQTESAQGKTFECTYPGQIIS
jgi:hypothetical protein